MGSCTIENKGICRNRTQRHTSLLALAEGLVVVALYDVKQRLFQLPLPTRRQWRLRSVHPVPVAAGRRSDSFAPPPTKSELGGFLHMHS